MINHLQEAKSVFKHVTLFIADAQKSSVKSSRVQLGTIGLCGEDSMPLCGEDSMPLCGEGSMPLCGEDSMPLCGEDSVACSRGNTVPIRTTRFDDEVEKARDDLEGSMSSFDSPSPKKARTAPPFMLRRFRQ